MKTVLLFIYVILRLQIFVYTLDEDGIKEKHLKECVEGLNRLRLPELKCIKKT